MAGHSASVLGEKVGDKSGNVLRLSRRGGTLIVRAAFCSRGLAKDFVAPQILDVLVRGGNHSKFTFRAYVPRAYEFRPPGENAVTWVGGVAADHQFHPGTKCHFQPLELALRGPQAPQ